MGKQLGSRPRHRANAQRGDDVGADVCISVWPSGQKVVEMAEDWVQPAWTAIAISKDDSLARTHACAVRQLQEGTFRKMNGVLSK